jgi:hypothetical protein
MSHAVEERLISACESACLAPLNDRRDLVSGFRQLIGETDSEEPNIKREFSRISQLLGI